MKDTDLASVFPAGMFSPPGAAGSATEPTSSNPSPHMAGQHHSQHPPAEATMVQRDMVGEEHNVEKTIHHEGSSWVLHFSDGRKETFSSEAAAKERERQVNYFKHHK